MMDYSSGDGEERKRKRLVSNRESARRSRMRKQHHLEDLIAQLGGLKGHNTHIITSIDITTRHCLDIEAENALLRVQMAELSNRLHSLYQIIHFINCTSSTLSHDFDSIHPSASLHQPILDTFMY